MRDKMNAAYKLIKSHLIEGEMTPDKEIAIKIDQTLTQDATGTMVMLELEALGLKRVKTDISVQYVDHNLLQTDNKNADDHEFLRSACQKYGIWYSPPGNGISHPIHMDKFGKPGKSLLGSDSHTPAGGALGMLAIGTGGIDVAHAMLGLPYYFNMPRVLGVKLRGKLPPWVSAKDVILEMLRRYDVKGCKGIIIEYYGPGLKNLSVMDRHVIANMGTELGATTTVFPSDEITYRYLKFKGREKDWIELKADKGAEYDMYDEIELSELEPLIACPSSPGNVVRVREVQGRPVHQVVIGSSANPGFRDFWIVGEILKDRTINENVSLDINPSTRQVIDNLASSGAFHSLIQAGARFHQAGCMGCIGMGQAPASGRISLRTMPRNFPGRSGTKDDQVYLCSPETGAASALTGVITDPRDLENLFNISYPKFRNPKSRAANTGVVYPPLEDGSNIKLLKGPNVKSLPEFEPLKASYKVPVLLKAGDNISTDEILPAGSKVLPLRSNIPEISRFTYGVIDSSFYDRALEAKKAYGGHIVVGGENYAQGSSREHAAIAPRYLGQVAVIAKSYARIGWQNLINFGILPLEFLNPSDYDTISQGDEILIEDLLEKLEGNHCITVRNTTRGLDYKLTYSFSERQKRIIMAGGASLYYRT
ncbi:MAG: aconitate hydratase [Bacillota bacterium]